AGGDAVAVARYVEKAIVAEGLGPATLFGTVRTIDYSQYKPRGHYAGDPVLELLFRAMMWLGREDLRLMDGTEINRRVLRGMLAMRSLLRDGDVRRWRAIDRALDAFVGKRDSMGFPEVDRIQKDLGAQNAMAALKLPDSG